MWNPSEWATQVGSFQNPVTPPTSQPCDSPTVSVCINQQWIPYVLGALLQLTQPSTWNVDSQADLLDILARVNDLLDAVGTAMPCVANVPALTGVSTSQQGCNIAGYMANIVIRGAMQKAIDAYNSGNTLIDYGILITSLIPDVGVLIPALARGLKDLYETIFGGNQEDFQNAAGDETLWSKVTCAIYNAISSDGQITDNNFATVQSNVAAIGYSPSDVQDAINAFLSDMGATTAQQLQATGALADYDCSSCGTGISTGPAALSPRMAAGSVSVTISAGDASATASVTFSPAFSIAPIITTNCENSVLIASAGSKATTGFVLTLTSAVPVLSDTTAVIDWIAAIPGGLS